MERVGFQQRTGAFFIDLGLLMVGVHLLIVVDVLVNQQDNYDNFGLISGCGGALLILVYSLLEIFWARTPGKRIMGLVIARDDGTPATRRMLAKRWAVKQSPVFFGTLATLLLMCTEYQLLSFYLPEGLRIFGIIDAVIGLVLAIFVCVGYSKVMQPQRQAFHDLVASTAVFRSIDVQSERGFAPVLPQPVIPASESAQD